MAEPTIHRSIISPRQTFISQRSNSAHGTQAMYNPSGGRTIQMISTFGPLYGGIPTQFSTNATKTIKESRDKDKKDLQDLNDRFATYIEKVRFLEAQNRKLTTDLDTLRTKWGKETTSIKQMYDQELKDARKLIDETAKDRAEKDKEIARLKDELKISQGKHADSVKHHDKDKEKMDGYITQLSDAEAEIGLLRRRIENLDDEVNRLKKDNNKLTSDLNNTKNELDQETLNRIDFQNQVQTLTEEIDFLKRLHDQEIKELQALIARDTTAENREFFKNELTLAIRDIRNEYDSIANGNKNEMENWYKMKVQEVTTAINKNNMESGHSKEETKRLRALLAELRGKLGDLESQNAMLQKRVGDLTNQLEDEEREYEAAINDRDTQIRRMRQECDQLVGELQALLETKQTLDSEILIYRKMLEGEENHKGLRQLVESVAGGGGGGGGRGGGGGLGWSSGGGKFGSGGGGGGANPNARTSFQRSAKGNVSIAETNPEGKFIILENTSRNKDESMDEWKLKRRIDAKREIVFTLPPNFALGPGKSVKIWARGQGGRHAPPDQLVCEGEDSWGTGANVQTILFNKEGEVKP